MAGPDDQELATYDNTKLVAYNTCPQYGILRYAHHKRFASNSRAMALEAGSAMHEVFAYVRLISLGRHLSYLGRPNSFVDTLLSHHGVRLFGSDRWSLIRDNSPSNEDLNNRLKNDVINVLESGAFFDDDRDKRRTLTNLTECALTYVDRVDYKYPVWMRDMFDPKSDVGIEIAYDIVCELDNVPSFRFTGRLDGLHYHGDKLWVCDNKTASRLSDSWELSWETSHQLTGYCLAATVFTGQHVCSAEVLGLAIPMPRSEYSGFMKAQTQRSAEQTKRFITWMLNTVEDYRAHAHDPINADQYTHSCNRYFRPCSFIPFCASDEDERKQMYNEMVVDEWSPLHIDTEGE